MALSALGETLVERDSLPSRRCFIHFHIPRTCGTWLRQSLIAELVKTCEPDQIFFVDGGPEWGCSFGPYRDLLEMDEGKRSRLRFVAGHMPTSVLGLFDQPFSFTIMREPTDRALSDYWYSYHTVENPAHPFARRLSPAEYCRQGFGQARNGHARYLADVAISGEQLSDAELLRRGARTLAHLNLVGLYGHLAPFLSTLEETIGTRISMSGERNEMARLRPPTDEELKVIRESNAVDYALYEIAQGLAASKQLAASRIA